MEVHRERTRSPRRRDGADGRHGRRRAGSPAAAAPVSLAPGLGSGAFRQLRPAASDGGLQSGGQARALWDEMALALEAALAPLRSEFSAMRRTLVGLVDKAEVLFSKLCSSAHAADRDDVQADRDAVLPLVVGLAGLALDSARLGSGEATNEAWSVPATDMPQHAHPITGLVPTTTALPTAFVAPLSSPTVDSLSSTASPLAWRCMDLFCYLMLAWSPRLLSCYLKMAWSLCMELA
uniref:Uncharacterized protein n=1 Tax=Triticum urartu TaxID=4572 RepID=A0A8R7R3Z1_TRIUA